MTEVKESATGGSGGAGGRRGLLARPLVIVGGILVLLAVAIGVVIWWLNARNYESTDDAYVDVHMVRLAPQTSGQVMY
jgi:membrane fusion protein (multidrug efflux system)